MFENYIKIAWRNMTRQKLYSLINISGLAVGLAVCMLIMLYVAHERSYDNFQKNGRNIFIPLAKIKEGGNTMQMTTVSYVSGPIIKESQPTVNSYVRSLAYFKPVLVSNPSTRGEKMSEDKLLFADANFFSFFSFKLHSGDAKSVLDKPFQVVLSADMAKKYFGTEDCVGKVISLKTDSNYLYQVTGVAENPPSNSSLNFNFVTSTESLMAMKEAKLYTGASSFGPGSFNLYVALNKASDTTTFRQGLDRIVAKNKMGDSESFSLINLASMHLDYNIDGANIRYLHIFPIVAGLILILALVNYMSLSTARATLRAKEVGVRKVTGASRKTIAAQFYVESAMYAVLSFVLGLVLCYVFKPVFFNTLQLKVDDDFLFSPLSLSLMGGLLLITILLAGGYPSIVLSAFKPVVTLKGKMGNQTGGVTVRKVFTTLQFATSVGLIICGIVIDRQLYFFRHADTGIDKDNVVMIPVTSSFINKYPAFKSDVAGIAGISAVATSHYAMYGGYDMFSIDGKTSAENTMLAALEVGESFFSTVGLKWKYPPTGKISAAGSNKVVINELAIDELHLPANPVGTYLESGKMKTEIVGVVKNFNFTSMAQANKALGMYVLPDTSRLWSRAGCNLFARINPHTNLPSLLDKVKAIYRKYDQDGPFTYTFMDEAFNNQYKAEDRLASIFSIFTGITILLATLGLFGLAAFTIQQRTKEIGIRKVLGAGVSTIATSISTDFLKLVVLSIVIASPVAWWAMHNWLQNFAYHISIQWWMFAFAGIIAVLSAIVTVSYHSLKAALANPVNSLRSE